MLFFINILKDAKKAGVFLLAFILVFFFYDNFFDFLIPYRDWPILTDLNQFLICTSIIILLIIFVFLKKLDISTQIVNFLNIVGISLVLINVVDFTIYNIFQDHISKSSLSQARTDPNYISQNNAFKDTNEFRDIYFIVLDGYPSTDVLMEYYNYNNQPFINSLKSKDFYIAEESRTNYPSATFLSLASTLNMKYINYLSKGIDNVNNFKDRKIPYEMIKNSKVASSLKYYGYKYVHFKSLWGPTDYNSYADINLGGPHSLALSQLNNEFNMVIARSTILREWLKKNNYHSLYSEQILFNLNKISELKSISNPKFVFAHIFSPHPPYVFDENGNTPDSLDMNYSGNENESRGAFINQLKFINKKIILAITKILDESKIKPIIVIQGDHGWGESLVERINILNAMYLPNGGNDLLYKEISPVNTFRLILNFYFEENYNILEDRHYNSSINSPYKFIDVTGG